MQKQPEPQKQNKKGQEIPIIFLAGRIDESDLRFGLIEYNMNFDKGDFENPCKANLRKTIVNNKELLYAGSFKIGYDIPQDSIIYQNLKKLEQFKQFAKDQKNKNRTIEEFLNKKTTYQRSMDGIFKSTHIFVWIQDQQCFGTLIQLGYAYSLNKHNSANKKIYITYSQNINPKSHLWFAFEACTDHSQFKTWKQGIDWFMGKL